MEPNKDQSEKHLQHLVNVEFYNNNCITFDNTMFSSILLYGKRRPETTMTTAILPTILQKKLYLAKKNVLTKIVHEFKVLMLLCAV